MNDLSRKSSPKVYLLEISSDRDGQRIDNFLISHLKGVPKSHIYRLLRKGEIRVNKKRIKADYRLKAKDCVRIPPIRVSSPQDRRPSDNILALIQERILFEDKNILIINKPAGVAVHGGSGLSYGIIEALRALRPDAPFLELVHRLDRETSGCLVIAKKRSALRLLHELFRGTDVNKQYLTLVQGVWPKRKRKVAAPLRKNVLKSGERMVSVDEQGKQALSYFDLESSFKMASLMRVTLKTGRTHQIRVHAVHMGHPIAGDEKYGDIEFNKKMRQYGLRRLFLHAERIEFNAPGWPPISVMAPLDVELQKVLKQLQKN